MLAISLVICAFIRKHYGDKIKIWGYVIFSCLFISNPLINQFFIYQSTNFAIVISNLMVIICALAIFENFFNDNKRWINIISGIILMIPISMYESCAQTYLVILFVTMFIRIAEYKENSKKIFKYFCTSIAMLILGIVLYYIIGYILLFVLDKLNLLRENFAHGALWKDEEFLVLPFNVKLMLINQLVLKKLSILSGNFPVIVFMSFSFLVIILEVVKTIKTKKASRLICVLGMILANFVLIVILLTVLFRTQFSWFITTAFMGLYIYQTLYNKKVIGVITKIVLAMLIITQTRLLNQYFYNDYKRYEREKVIANDIALNVIKNCDYKNKPLICLYTQEEKKKYHINMDNGSSVITWGMAAFKEIQTELTRFINEQGYDFLYITRQQCEKVYEEYIGFDKETRNRYLIELDDVIIVNLNAYDL